jgi:hypothetical protein
MVPAGDQFANRTLFRTPSCHAPYSAFVQRSQEQSPIERAARYAIVSLGDVFGWLVARESEEAGRLKPRLKAARSSACARRGFSWLGG